MNDRIAHDNKTLVDFWNAAFALTDEERAGMMNEAPESPECLAPSPKLYAAACALGKRKKVIDLGCGQGWAAIAAAKAGCPDVTAADPAPNAASAAELCANAFGVGSRVHAVAMPDGWLGTVPDGEYDGLISVNVLDTVPPETSRELIREAARIVSADADVVIGLNYYLSPEAAAERNIPLGDGGEMYLDGVLRLVSRSDGEWEALFKPYFSVESLGYYSWPGETKETRRLFRLKKK
ncbi:MAG: class I SAM-dependent methyltransferase [Clostridia bacterium]|nr:class I SAM-dependent methyltransferase [Clostridia bacterium]